MPNTEKESTFSPLTREEIVELLKKLAASSDFMEVARIHVRIVQAIPGIVSPHPASGMIRDKISQIDTLIANHSREKESTAEEVAEKICNVIFG